MNFVILLMTLDKEAMLVVCLLFLNRKNYRLHFHDA